MTSAYQMVGITSKHQQAGGPTELTGDHQPWIFSPDFWLAEQGENRQIFCGIIKTHEINGIIIIISYIIIS
jgi:hypothetical protein